MDPEQRQEEIFSEAIKFEDRSERDAYLAGACGDDQQLLARVQSLLHHHDKQAFLDSPALGAVVTLDDSPLTEGPGTVIGRYKLLQQIGEGGFGVVYMAEQQKPIRRRVALKIIKLGMDTKQVIARFEAERQALAMMDHPNIAHVFDAGTTDTGRPYFVMELVKGVPITEYCDSNNLSTDERLGLFIDVCKAVQHAHQKGIIHRDIKPSNVMITMRDGVPVPKVIDFGIAKATQQRLTEKTVFTEYRQFIGTPEYMSPEQAEMSELDVDTRSDIYSLGVLLYELLTGTTPFDAQKLRSAAFDEIVRIIREAEPPKPSTRLSTLGDTLGEVARHRHAGPEQLCKIVRGDLDWIVMRTLEKDRTRRYETSHELAMDIERYMNDEPVTAGPPSTAYRIKKFVRRNQTVVTGVLLIAAALVVGLVLATVGFVRANQERNRAVLAETEAITQRDAAEQARRAEAQQRQRASVNFGMASDAVAKMTQIASGQLADTPEIKDMRRRLLSEARSFYEKFLDQQGDDPQAREEIGRAYRQVGAIHWALGENKEAEQSWRQMLTIYKALLEEFPTIPEYRQGTAAALAFLAPDYDIKLHQQAYELRSELVAQFPDNPGFIRDMATSHSSLGLTLSQLGRHQESISHLRKGVELSEQLTARFPDDDSYRIDLAHRYHWLGSRLFDCGEIDEAEKYLRQCHTLRKNMLASHPGLKGNFIHIQEYISWLLLETGQTKEAEEILREATASADQLTANAPAIPDYRNLQVECYNLLSEVLLVTGRWEESKALVDKVMEIKKTPVQSICSYKRKGCILQQKGLTTEAEQAFRRAIEIGREFGSRIRHNHARRDFAWVYYELGCLLWQSGRQKEAREAFTQAKVVFEEGSRSVLVILRSYAIFLTECPDRQFRDVDLAIELFENFLEDFPRSELAWRVLGLAYYRAGRWQDSIEAVGNSIELSVKGGNSFSFFLLALAHWQLGNEEESSQWYDKAVEWMDKNMSHHPELLKLRVEAESLIKGEEVEIGK